MSKSDYQQAVAELKEELALIETKAKGVSTRVEALAREAESSKIVFLQHFLEVKMRSEARRRGMVWLIKDKKRLSNSVLISVSDFVLQGFITQDKFVALHTGLSSFNSELQELGHANWAVSLGKRISVAPIEEVTSEGEWITWESLKTAMAELRKRALSGKVMGDLDSVISELKQEGRVLVFVVSPVANLSAPNKTDAG